MLRVKAPTAQGRLTLCCFCIWNSSASGHATAPTRKNDRAYRPSSVCPSGSHLPPGEGIPQMSRYTFTLSNRIPSEPRKRGPPPPARREAAPHRKPPRNSCASEHAAAPTEFAGDACGIGFSHTPSTLTIGFCEKFRERGKIVVEFMGVLCYDNAVSIWACCALK